VNFSREQDFRRFGEFDFRSLEANPGNVFSLTKTNLPGLDAGFAAIPSGNADAVMTAESFAATAGELNRTSLGRFRSIYPDVWRISAAASDELDVSPATGAFVELLGTQKKNESLFGPPTLNHAVVPSDNAFEPFHTPVAVSTLLLGAQSQSTITAAKFIRAVTGVRGIRGPWEAEIATSWTDERATTSATALSRSLRLSPNLGHWRMREAVVCSQLVAAAQLAAGLPSRAGVCVRTDSCDLNLSNYSDPTQR